ncbi:MAG: hypothetical protein JNK63_00715 [Chthonomonas sp.]|nr:hypothetical protein [Chthonomonas sp.]
MSRPSTKTVAIAANLAAALGIGAFLAIASQREEVPMSTPGMHREEMEELWQQIKDLGVPHDVYGKTLGGGCCVAASTYGVSANCLCASIMAERSWWEHDPLYKRCSDDLIPMDGSGPFGPPTVGCIQQNGTTIMVAIQKLRKCKPDLLMKFKYANLLSISSGELHELIKKNCPAAMELAALWLAAIALPQCNNGKVGSCGSFVSMWNGGPGGGPWWHRNLGPEVRNKAKVVFETLQAAGTPCGTLSKFGGAW